MAGAGSYKWHADDYLDQHEGLMTQGWFKKHVTKCAVPATRTHPGLQQSFGPFNVSGPLTAPTDLSPGRLQDRQRRFVSASFGPANASASFARSGGNFAFDQPSPTAPRRVRSLASFEGLSREGGGQPPSSAGSRASSAGSRTRSRPPGGAYVHGGSFASLGKNAPRNQADGAGRGPGGMMTSNQIYGTHKDL